MVCIIMAKRRLPIFAFIISSIGAICVIMSSPPPPPPPPKPPNWAFAGIDVSVNNSSSVAAWHTTLSAPVMAKLHVRRAAEGGAVGTHGARLGKGRQLFCEKNHTGDFAFASRGELDVKPPRRASSSESSPRQRNELA